MYKLKLVIMGLLLLVAGSVYAYDDGDFQVWNTDVEEFKINKDTKLAFEEEFRWGDNAGEFFYQHYDIGLFYTLNKYLNIGGGYRYIKELKKGKFKLENDPYLTATLSLSSHGFTLESRSRFEYRSFDYQADSWRYRNKFTLKAPWKFTKLQIQPYLSDEIFAGFASGTNQFSQNRFSAGLGMSITKNIKAELYYMLVKVRSSGKWPAANVLGTKVKLAF